MTSEISFRKLVVADARGRRWLPFLIAIVSFLIFVIGYSFLFQISGTNGQELLTERPFAEKSDMAQTAVAQTISYMGRTSFLIPVSALIAALLAGISGFFWLQNSEQVDFYHSMAVRRDRLFLAVFVSGAEQVILPFVLFDLMGLLFVPLFYGVMSGQLFLVGLQGMAIGVIEFLSLYAFVCLAVILAGRATTSILLIVIFFAYGPVAFVLLDYLKTTFLDTIVYHLGDVAAWLSPAFLSFYRLDSEISGKTSMLVIALYGVAALLLAMLAYRRRPSEATGKAFVFDIVTPIVKCLLLLIISLGFGSALGSIASESLQAPLHGGWSVFGILFGAFLGNAIVELLFQPDFRNIKRHWRSGVFSAAMALAIFAVLYFDPFRVNTWIPDRASVMAMSIDARFVDDAFVEEYSTPLDEAEQGGGERRPWVKDCDALYGLAQTCVQARRAGTDPAGATYTDRAIADSMQVKIGYRFKNGTTKFRTYRVMGPYLYEMLEEASQVQEFREQYYATAAGLTGQYTYVTLQPWDFTRMEGPRSSIGLTKEEGEQLNQAFATDSLSQSLGQLEEQTPIGVLQLRNSKFENRVFIYPSFTHVLSFLKDRGLDPTADFPVAHSISIDLYSSEYSFAATFKEPEKIQLLSDILTRETPFQAVMDQGQMVRLGVSKSDDTYVYCEAHIDDVPAFEQLIDVENGNE